MEKYIKPDSEIVEMQPENSILLNMSDTVPAGGDLEDGEGWDQ